MKEKETAKPLHLYVAKSVRAPDKVVALFEQKLGVDFKKYKYIRLSKSL
jgi:hypothetical protein